MCGVLDRVLFYRVRIKEAIKREGGIIKSSIGGKKKTCSICDRLLRCAMVAMAAEAAVAVHSVAGTAARRM